MINNKYIKTTVFLLSLCCLVICVAVLTSMHVVNAQEDSSEYAALPYKTNSEKTYDYIYAVGGYHSVDNGCPAWGTSNESDIRFIGERMGDLLIKYKDGSEDRVPLIFGYTMWWYSNWKEECAPFKGEGTVA